jgi:uncharacterized membrane protein YciS (DUF1049 family)
MRKFIFYFGFICATVLLELLYLNLQLDKKISKIENTQKQYNFAIESLNKISDQTLDGIDRSITPALSVNN